MTALEELRGRIVRRWAVNSTFTLNEVYGFETDFASLYPQNAHIRPKLRQLLQLLRDEGTVRFLNDRGAYQRLK